MTEENLEKILISYGAIETSPLGDYDFVRGNRTYAICKHDYRLHRDADAYKDYLKLDEAKQLEMSKLKKRNPRAYVEIRCSDYINVAEEILASKEVRSDYLSGSSGTSSISISSLYRLLNSKGMVIPKEESPLNRLKDAPISYGELFSRLRSMGGGSMGGSSLC